MTPLPDDARILFLQYEKALGTAVIATATLAALRARRPEARITVAAAGLPAELLRASPLVDELLVTPHPVDRFAAAMAFAVLHLRPRRFDVVITDGGNPRSKVTAMALAAGAPRRAGMAVHPFLYNFPVRPDPGLSNLSNNLLILDALGISGTPEEPQVYFSAEALAEARRLLPKGRCPLVALVTQTSRGHPNAWFDDRWGLLARSLEESLGASLVFLGAPSDRSAIDSLRAATPDAISLAGQTALPVLGAVLTQCDLVITIDTGSLHVARGVGAPTVVLGNAAQPTHWWLPAGDPRHLVLRKDHVPCALCLRMACETRECMQEIEVGEVVAAARRQLDRFPPSAEARAARASARLVAQPPPQGSGAEELVAV